MNRGINSTFEVAINWTLYLKKPPSRSTQLKSCRSDVLPSHPYPTRTTSERMNTHWRDALNSYKEAAEGEIIKQQRRSRCLAAPQEEEGQLETDGPALTMQVIHTCPVLTAAVFSAKKMLQMLSGDFSETMSESCNWNADRLWQLNTFITRGTLLSEPAPLLSLNSPRRWYCRCGKALNIYIPQLLPCY